MEQSLLIMKVWWHQQYCIFIYIIQVILIKHSCYGYIIFVFVFVYCKWNRTLLFRNSQSIYYVGIPVKSTLDNSTTVQYAGLMSQLSDKARSVVRDLDPGNDLTFLRVRSKKHEIMVAPDKDFILIVIQNPSD